MDRELHPAETLYDAEDGLLGGADPYVPRDGEALPDDAATLPQPPEPGGALPDLTETSTPPAETGTTARRTPGQRGVNYTIIHPSQIRFECPMCKLVYTSHHSLVRHVGVSHSRLALTISYKCAMCDYAHTSLRSTSSHYRLSHGAAVPPVAVEGSNEKACPFCPRKFPSTRSCSTHIREKHMEQASAQRAREAADKEAQRGTTTTGTKWGEGEIRRFKEALARLGPSDNAKLAEAVGTRDKTQVSAFKCRFLKKYPTWLKDHRPPEQQAALNLNGPPTPSPTSPQAMADHHPPSTRSESREETAGTPPLTPGQLGGQEETDEQSPHPQTPPSQEEQTPSPQPAPQSEETAAKIRLLDHHLLALRSAPAVEQWEPEPWDLSPPAQAPTPLTDTLSQPAAHAHALAQTVPITHTCTPSQTHTHTPPPPHTHAHTLDTSSLTQTHTHTPPPPHTHAHTLDTSSQQGEATQDLPFREEALAILGLENIQMWDPEEELLSPTLLAGIATPPPTSPASDVDNQLQLPPATITPLVTTEVQEQPPPSIFRSLLHVPAFVPSVPQPLGRTEQPDQALRSSRGGESSDTSPPPTPPTLPVTSLPLTAVSARRHQALGMDVITRQPLTVPPSTVEPAQPTPPSSPPGLPPHPARSPGSLERITIDPDNMDSSLRMPFHQELLPFVDRRLGDYEWVTFEGVLERWSRAIKEVVTAQQSRPPHPTSQWARRRRRRQAGNQPQSPPSPTLLSPEPSQPTEPQDSNNRASGRARRAAKSRRLQKLYRANPGVCMRRILDNSPPVYCTIGEQELVNHFTTIYAEPPPLDPPPSWLFPDRHPGDPGTTGTTDEGDVLQFPITPEEVVTQFRRTKRTAPGSDGITYASWRWVDPQGLILATIFNICRINMRVPRPWKHSTVTLIHKGGDVTSVRN